MTDKELLELAAKASDFSYLEYTKERYPSMAGLVYGNPNGRLRVWNPLEDDGDAFRLAVALRMEIDHNYPADEDSWVLVRAQSGRSVITEEFDDENQRAAFTRRAIVRAAAEIGKQLNS